MRSQKHWRVSTTSLKRGPKVCKNTQWLLYKAIASNNRLAHLADRNEWLNRTLPNLNLPLNASDEEFRTLLADGTLLCRLMNKLGLGPAIEVESSYSIKSKEGKQELELMGKWEMIDVCDALEPMSLVFEGEKELYGDVSV
ncbi:kinesin-like protein KIN-14C [Tanacetum coccineum]